MTTTKKIACIIPARLNSSRFPRKILSILAGKPLLEWSWQSAHNTNSFSDITFAVDSQETEYLIKTFGGKSVMTSIDCQSGTDRLAEIVNSGKIDADIFVNWQADEPFISTKMIQTLLQSCNEDNNDVWTLKKKILEPEQITSVNFAKVVCDANNNALYFSRSPIPFHCPWGNEKNNSEEADIYYKHVGIYAFTRNAIKKISTLAPCYNENSEKLEQLRFLHYGLKIKVHETDQEVIGIDTPQDLQKAEIHALQLNK